MIATRFYRRRLIHAIALWGLLYVAAFAVGATVVLSWGGM